MHKLEVQEFGPIEFCEIELNKLNILIGPQSSGKSTICKLFYFFLHIRDEYAKFLIESANENKASKFIIKDFGKLIRKRFVEFWGPTPQVGNVYLKYHYSESIQDGHLLAKTDIFGLFYAAF